MIKVELKKLENYLLDVFRAGGLNSENAAAAADVYMRATLRGVGHHDIYDLPSRIQKLKSASVAANPEYKKLAAFGSIESWDAGNGLGEVVCVYAMNRAMDLAGQYGMGLCAMRNTNHFLAAAPYVEMASEKGFVALMLSKGKVSMGAPDKAGTCMSALPMGFAYSTEEEYPVMLDACMAYASFGKLEAMAKTGETTKEWWGYDEEGNPTTDPKAMAKGTRLPIGGHKGFGLAMLGEVLTSVLSFGPVLDEEETVDGLKNNSSHTAIAIKADALMDMAAFKKRTSTLSNNAKALSPGLHIPGMGSYKCRVKFTSAGGIELENELVDKLDKIASSYNIAGLSK